MSRQSGSRPAKRDSERLERSAKRQEPLGHHFAESRGHWRATGRSRRWTGLRRSRCSAVGRRSITGPAVGGVLDVARPSFGSRERGQRCGNSSADAVRQAAQQRRRWPRRQAPGRRARPIHAGRRHRRGCRAASADRRGRCRPRRRSGISGTGSVTIISARAGTIGIVDPQHRREAGGLRARRDHQMVAAEQCRDRFARPHLSVPASRTRSRWYAASPRPPRSLIAQA